jgi:hypothetical protein
MLARLRAKDLLWRAEDSYQGLAGASRQALWAWADRLRSPRVVILLEVRTVPSKSNSNHYANWLGIYQNA